jgi:hypothetical protein
MNKGVERALNKELRRLQHIFQTGTELKILYRPGEIRINQMGKDLSGEVNGSFIIIYELDRKRAISTLYHEFVEYMIMPLIKDYLDIINGLNLQITSLLVKRKEEVVERFIKSLNGE